MAARGRGLFSLYIYMENFKNLLVRSQWTDFNIILQKCSYVIFYQDCSIHLDSSKNMAARGRGFFSLYIYIENFKNLLVRNHWTDFNILLQKCSFGGPLPRLLKPFGFVKKNGRQRAGLIFPIYLHGKFKKSSCEKQLTDFNIILQKCFFGDSLPRLFKPFGFVKNITASRAGLFFPIYLYRKL